MMSKAPTWIEPAMICAMSRGGAVRAGYADR